MASGRIISASLNGRSMNKERPRLLWQDGIVKCS
jgi:hypothetical protein